MELKDKIDEPEFETKPQQYDIPWENYQLTRDGARRSIRPPQRFGYNDMVAYSLSIGEELSCAEPKNYLEAISCKDSPKWMTAMQEEFESLLKNGTWQLVDKPKGCKVVGCKWVFKKKLGIPHVEPERFKARLVAKAYTQREGMDFNEIFSPMVKHTSIRVLLALVSLWNLELEQMDVNRAFLHGELEEEIFMQQPKGFIVKGKENQVCLLKRSLYGLKQSPRQWYKRFDKFMTSVGYSRSKFDNCVYMRKLTNGSYVYLLLYVDDMLLASKSITEIAHLKTQLQSEFEMKDLGCAKKILGIEPYRDRSTGILTISQRDYIERVLKIFNMDAAKAVDTPIGAQFKLSYDLSPKTEEEMQDMSNVAYANDIESIMYYVFHGLHKT